MGLCGRPCAGQSRVTTETVNHFVTCRWRPFNFFLPLLSAHRPGAPSVCSLTVVPELPDIWNSDPDSAWAIRTMLDNLVCTGLVQLWPPSLDESPTEAIKERRIFINVAFSRASAELELKNQYIYHSDFWNWMAAKARTRGTAHRRSLYNNLW